MHCPYSHNVVCKQERYSVRSVNQVNSSTGGLSPSYLIVCSPASKMSQYLFKILNNMYRVRSRIEFIRVWFCKRVTISSFDWPCVWFDYGQQFTKIKHMKEFEMNSDLSHILDPGFSKMLLRWRCFLYPRNVKRDWIIGSRWPNSYHNPLARMLRIYVAFFLGKSNPKIYANIYRPFVLAKITEFVFFSFSHRMSVLGHQGISRRYVN